MADVQEKVKWGEIEEALALPKGDEGRPHFPAPPRADAGSPRPAGAARQFPPSKPAVPRVRTRAERRGMLALGTLGGGLWLVIGLWEALCNESALSFFKWSPLAMTPIGLTAGIVAGSWAGGAVTAVRKVLRYGAATLFLLAAPLVSVISLFVYGFLGAFYVMLRLSFF